MSTNVKIVMAGINIACLIVTLLVPSSITPLILLTTIVSIVSWVFTTKPDSPRTQVVVYLYVAYATLLAIICIVFGVTASVEVANAATPNEYVFLFDNTVAKWGGQTYPYEKYAWLMFISIVSLMFCEILSAMLNDLRNKKSSIPIACRVASEIAKYR